MGVEPADGASDSFWSERTEAPGSTEELGDHGTCRLGRAFGVSDHLMKVDTIARRGEIGPVGDYSSSRRAPSRWRLATGRAASA